MPVNYYSILEITSDASLLEIKSSFRKLAKRYHPDVNPSVEAAGKFKEAYTAYEVLSDPFKKKLYDEIYHNKSTTVEEYEAKMEAEGRSDFRFYEWEAKAAAKAETYSKMNYSQFRKTELKGFDFISHQFLLIGLATFLFLMGGGILFYVKEKTIEVINGESPPTFFIGFTFLVPFALMLIYQVIKLVTAFKNSFLHKVNSRKKQTP